MKKKQYYQQELADVEASLMYLKVDMNKFDGDKDSKEFRAMLSEEARLLARVEDLTELTSC